MTEFFATLELPIEFTAKASGDGLWGMNAGYTVHFKSILVRIADYGDCHSIEVRFVHEKVPYSDGLCYTDSGIRDTCRRILAQITNLFFIDPASVNGSEQGMQYHSYFSCDADEKEGIPFTKSYFEDLSFIFED